MLRAWCFVGCWVVLLGVFLTAGAVAEEVTPGAGPSVRFSKTWGGHGSAPGQFNLPIGIAVGASGEVFVTDHYNDRVQRFDGEGKLIACFTVLPNPGGIGIDTAGNLYIAHFAAALLDKDKPNAGDFITVYAPDGTLLRQWGQRGTGDGEFNCPGGVAVGKDGRVYVADQTNHRIQVFDTSGKFLLKWGEHGNAQGQFGGADAAYSRTGGPQFVALDAAGHVWTTEGLNCRVQSFTSEGKFLAAWGDSADRPGSLGAFFIQPNGAKGRLQGPIAVCVDAADRLWISAVSGRVQQFAQDGTYLCGVGEGQGDAEGQFFIPHGIALDGKGHLYVVDALNHRVQKFDVWAPN